MCWKICQNFRSSAKKKSLRIKWKSRERIVINTKDPARVLRQLLIIGDVTQIFLFFTSFRLRVACAVKKLLAASLLRKLWQNFVFKRFFFNFLMNNFLIKILCCSLNFIKNKHNFSFGIVQFLYTSLLFF